ncbi:MAG: tRNA (adenosine(37)-N6)-threonylcarbamoyltransferase complex transferase subunit TsaD [Candidatus Hinthialibacter antarcticus]|nr:tRNA (adenosine(37)-N6)-threonylcarbamoyltransferase complex transferase subunit TsaD [Candidatus Hinthialibacter antarcticus]
MRILGIETSCDDTGVAIVDAGNGVLTNLVASQVDLHRPYGGVVPEIASRAHIENLSPLVQRALQDASVKFSDLDAIAVTYTPGLSGCLLVGVSYAKALAYSLGVPLIGVNHLEAHIFTSALDVAPEDQPPFPHLSLLVSGGHTALYRIDSWTQQTLLGSTKDDAAGEAFDKVAKLLALGFPGGPVIQKRAEGYDGEWIEFPRPMLHQGLDFSFSGLKTAVLQKSREKELCEDDVTQIAASFQRAAVDVLVSKTLKAAKQFGLRDISLVGGVSANKALREELTRRASEKGCKVYLPDFKYAMDNGAMVAGLAHHYYQEKRFSDLTLNAIA